MGGMPKYVREELLLQPQPVGSRCIVGFQPGACSAKYEGRGFGIDIGALANVDESRVAVRK